MERKLTDRIETYDHEIKGYCTCGTEVLKVINSSVSGWKDKTRYRYPNDNTAANIFRCRNCMNVIQETFIAGGLVLNSNISLNDATHELQ